MNPLDMARWLWAANTRTQKQYEAVLNFPTLQRNWEKHQAYLARVYSAMMRPGYNPTPQVVMAYGEAEQLLRAWKSDEESMLLDLRRAAAEAMRLGKLTPAQVQQSGLGLLPMIVAAVAGILATALVFISAIGFFSKSVVQDRANKRMYELQRQTLDRVPTGDLPGVISDVFGGDPGSGESVGDAARGIGLGAMGIAALAAVLLLGPTLKRSLR